MRENKLTFKEIKEELFRKAEETVAKSIYGCLQCGVCSASCPSGRITPFRTRLLIRKTLLGVGLDIKKEDLWLCTTCYTCQERCPKRIEIVSIIITLRNIAVEKGNLIPEHLKICQNFIRYGHAVPLDNENKEKRTKLGLAKNPPAIQFIAEALKQLQFLVKKLEFDKKVEFGWDS
jgi:heterodisulfide reductase subunit C